MSWDGLAGTQVRTWHSPAESSRFGIGVGRLVVGYDVSDTGLAEERLVEELRSSTEDLLILRWPAHLTRLGAVAAQSDRWVFPADTLTYWEVPSTSLAASDEGDAEIGIVRSDEVSDAMEQAISAVVRDSFEAYGSHYSANPRLDPSQALAGYIEWAVAAYREDPGHVVLATRHGEPIGVATLSPHVSDLEIELAGLTPAAQGLGLYGRLLGAVGRVALAESRDRVIISTQVHNVRVQRAWVRAGLKPFAAVATVHAMKR